MKHIACLFVNYNNSLLTIKCIESLLDPVNDSLVIRIVIIDNFSRQEEKNILIAYFQNRSPQDNRVDIIFLEKNIGYFPALNHAYISNSNYINKCDYVIIGNNDLEFDKDFLSVLQHKVFNDDIYVVSPDIINRDNNHQNPQIVYRYTGLQLLHLDLYHSSYIMACMISTVGRFIKFKGSQKSKEGYTNSQYISIGYGACYILTRHYISNVGFIPDYLFLMNEENALTDAVLNRNGRIYYDADLIVHHMEHTSINLTPKKKMYKIVQESYKISKKHFNNRYLYDKKIVKND